MRKDWNSISQNMTLQGIMWRLGSLFSLLLIFTSTSLFASENPSSETFVHASPVVEEPVQADQPEKTTVYVTEGTVVYGLEDLSQNAEIKQTVEKKTIHKASVKKTRNTAIAKKITQKVKTQQQESSPEVTTDMYSQESKGSFNISKKQLVAGALTLSHSFKAITAHHYSDVFLAYLSNVTATYKYTFSFTPNTMHSHSFTRPPPFI